MEESGLSIRTTSLTECELVSVRGEVDTIGAPLLAEALETAASGGRPVVVDLSELGFIDSSGLHALLTGPKGVGRALVCPPGNVSRILGIVQASDAVLICERLEDAVDRLRAGSARAAKAG